MHGAAIWEDTHQFFAADARPVPHAADVEMHKGRSRGRVEADAATLQTQARSADVHERLWAMHGLALSAPTLDEEVAIYRRAIAIKPDFPLSRAFLASAAANVGDMETARAALAVFRRLLPGYTLRKFAEERVSDRAEYLAKSVHFFDGLRKAGLEE